MTKIAYTGGGTVGHVSVNLSLIPTSIEKRSILYWFKTWY